MLIKHKIVVFCDSDFFHGKDWSTVLLPRIMKGNNPDYWIKKIERNMERDKKNTELLTSMGWTVIRFWGSEISKNLEGCLEIIERQIQDEKERNIL